MTYGTEYFGCAYDLDDILQEVVVRGYPTKPEGYVRLPIGNLWNIDDSIISYMRSGDDDVINESWGVIAWSMMEYVELDVILRKKDQILKILGEPVQLDRFKGSES